MIDWTHAFSLAMETRMATSFLACSPAAGGRRRARRGPARAAVLPAAAGPKLADLPPDVAAAMPTISAEQAEFVLAARERGAFVTGDTVADDLETGTTVCWALENGGVTLGEIARHDNDQPLGNEGEQLRTKRLMAAAVDSLCPDYKDQVAQLNLP